MYCETKTISQKRLRALRDEILLITVRMLYTENSLNRNLITSKLIEYDFTRLINAETSLIQFHHEVHDLYSNVHFTSLSHN